jgi:3-phosphoshikimate 1-carboxyvinyltransferase
MSAVRISPCASLSGQISVPGDKSISHRAAILSAIATGTSSIAGFLESEDCLNTLEIVEKLGAAVTRTSGRIEVTGCSGVLSQSSSDLDCGNSGTGMRLLAGLLAGQPFESRLTGDASLSSRPMKRIGDPLVKMGASVELTGEKGTAPITVRGGSITGIEYAVPMASAQVKSCILLAGLFSDDITTVIERRPTRDHTERMLIDAGADVVVEGLTVKLAGGGARKLQRRDWAVPGDFSSAAFWIVAASAIQGSELCLKNIGLNPRRTALIAVLQRMGADIQVTLTSGDACEMSGDIAVKGARLVGTEIAGDEIPNLIDELPVLSVAAALADGTTTISDAEELRVKECDRIAAMAENLKKAGVSLDEKPDGMVIEGKGLLVGGCEAESYGDHRIAMAMAIAGLCSKEGIRLNDIDCILTSYPSFWTDMDKLAEGCRG